MIKIKRAYEPVGRGDGYRVLVDRLWPRGIKKTDLVFDEWAKELAPSNELRRSFGHDPDLWKNFRSKYQFELRSKEVREKLESLADCARGGNMTLLYAARDPEFNNAAVLKEVMDRYMRRSPGRVKSSRRAA